MVDQTYCKSIEVSTPAETLFEWHSLPGAFDRLVPPWESAELISHEGLEEGCRAVIRVRFGPFSKDWVAEHRNYREGVSFEDVQIGGPFSRWEHSHQISSVDERVSILTDSVIYRLPGGRLGSLLGSGYISRRLERMFCWRHRRTHDDVTFHQRYRKQPRMNILITGGHGLIGQELRSLLTSGGHQVVILSRKPATNEHEREWDPALSEYDPAWFANCDAVIHLAGENISGHRWTTSFKRQMWDSRTDVTRKLVAALVSLDLPPQTLISASAIGWYGDRGSELLNEDSSMGEGYLSDLCEAWEVSSHPAQDVGIRVVNPRIGVVLSPKGGALKKMLTPFRFGAGGILGNGEQYMSWIGLDDIAGAIYHALMTNSLTGPLNCVAPNPVTNREFTKELGYVLWRPTIFPLPAVIARLAFGDMADALLLASTRVEPTILEKSGYEFRTPNLKECLRHQLGIH